MLYISELRHIKIDIFYDIYKYFLVEHKILFGFATIKKKMEFKYADRPRMY